MTKNSQQKERRKKDKQRAADYAEVPQVVKDWKKQRGAER